MTIETKNKLGNPPLEVLALLPLYVGALLFIALYRAIAKHCRRKDWAA